MKITSVVPARFRSGENIEINGMAFSPTGGANAVTIGTVVAGILEESDTRLLVTVPGGIPTDEFVAVQVQRSDSGDNTAESYWSKAPRADLLNGTVRVPSQAPGVLEARSPEPVRDTPQAQDYDAYLTALEYLIFEVLTTKGDVLGSSGVGAPARFPVGAAGQALQAAPAAGLGLAYGAAPASGRLTLDWGKQIDAGGAANGAMVANGLTTDQSTTKGEHASPIAGTADSLIVLVQAASGDTLDRVVLLKNGVIAYDSGTGLGLGANASHSASPAVAVAVGDRLELQAFKAGASAVMQLRGKVGVV